MRRAGNNNNKIIKTTPDLQLQRAGLCRRGTKFMADIRFQKKHTLTTSEAKERIGPVIEKTAREYGLRYRWEGDVCYFKGPAKGYVAVREDSIIMAAKLSLMAKLLKSSIRSQVQDELEKVLS